MTTHICRDYAPANSGFQFAQISYMYLMSLFVYRVLGYSVVGSTALNLDTPNRTLSVLNASNTSPITITTTTPHGFSNDTSNSVFISGVGGNVTANGSWAINVTGTNTFQLLGANATNPYTSGGTITTGFLIASGSVAGSTGTGINYGTGVEKEIAIPVSSKKVLISDVGRIIVLKSNKYPTKNSGLFKITGINAGNNTTITAGSNGASLPQGTINVVSTTGFPTSGTIYVTTSTGTFPVAYTGTTATTFTGCTGGSGVMSTGGAVANLNRYQLDYRSTENPPIEADNSMDWWMYENEVSASYLFASPLYNPSLSATTTNTTPIQVTTNTHSFVTGQRVKVFNVVGNTNANGSWTITVTGGSTFTLDGSVGNGVQVNTGNVILDEYMGKGVGYNSRIIFQSPHASGWQVRICSEYRGSGLASVTVCHGVNGNSRGDFPTGIPQAHIAEYFNVNVLDTGLYQNLTPGGANSSNTITRFTMVGDDTGSSFFAFNRANNGMVLVGLPDNEQFPSSPSSERVFSYGSGSTSSSGGGINLRVSNLNMSGIVFRRGLPKFCALTGWGNLDGVNNAPPPFVTTASDSSFTNYTEILPIEVWAGTNCDINLSTGIVAPFNYDPEFLGTSPLLRMGRANFGDFTLSTEEATTRNINAATNASPIQITTTATNTLVTGQTVTISGVQGNTAANGTWTITVINGTTFTLNGSTGNGAYTSGGTVNGCPRWLHLQNGVYLQWNGPAGLTA